MKPSQENLRPNILFAISDDQSHVHTSFAGCQFISTPAFDRIAREGVYFANCLAGSPGCAPSRSSIVTGRYHWQNESSGQHASHWLDLYVPFVDLLNKNGYATGVSGKGVGPFYYARDAEDSLWRDHNAAGITHSRIEYMPGTKGDMPPAEGISTLNYFENFKYFMKKVRGGKPFFFWYGAYEPHRDFEKGSWQRTDKKLEDVEVPDFLPDNEESRGDLLDYAVEIEWFDHHLLLMLEYLEEIGELENTVVIVTSDNGMAFPRAKANCYEYGVHVPMAVRFPIDFPGGRIVDDPVSFIDLAPTILEITGTSPEGMLPLSGKNMLGTLRSEEQGFVDDSKQHVLAGRERHSSSRYRNWGYPQRVIRSRDFIYIWNIRYERWPAGAPQKYDPENPEVLLGMFGLDEAGRYIHQSAFTDIDDCPTKAFIIENHKDEQVRRYFELVHAKRPEFELYDYNLDPACLNNLAGNPEFHEVEMEIRDELMKILNGTEDPRVVGPDTEVFDSYPRYSKMRHFPEPLAYDN